MESTLSTQSNETTASPRSPARSIQSRLVAQRIITAREQITAVQHDAELSALLETYGYTSAQLVEGMVLQTAAQNAYNARQTAIGAFQQARLSLITQTRKTLQSYHRFRRIARGLLSQAEARVALGVKGKVPRERETWLAHAQASYTTALNTPAYLDVFEAHGYTATVLQANLAEVANVVALMNQVRAQRAHAVQATETRTGALVALDVWLARFLAVTEYATHARPDLWRKVNV